MNKTEEFAMLWCPTLGKKDDTDWTEKSIADGLLYFRTKYKVVPTVVIVRNPEKLLKYQDTILKDILIEASNAIHDNYIAIATKREGYFPPKTTVMYNGG